ncbi:MAG: hypothetical protein FIA89_03505 [Geobacter sp.]|nr:hypothetical protein [Geobacter sp.]
MQTDKLDLLETETIKAALAAGKSVRHVSKLTGRSRPTIDKVKADHKEDIQAMSERLADSFFETAERALAHISDEKLSNSNARDLGILSGVMVDKARLLSGESTQNVAVLSYFGGLIEAFNSDPPEE